MRGGKRLRADRNKAKLRRATAAARARTEFVKNHVFAYGRCKKHPEGEATSKLRPKATNPLTPLKYR